MNYLRITNQGLICAEDLTLIGSSTKRDKVGLIGIFGSGWKYALSWMLRNDCTPTIFSGTEEIKVDTTVKLHRDTPVNVITVNGIETSLTTQMGPKWTGWMAIREVLSNAIDEGSHTINTAWSPQLTGEDGKTVVYIPMNGELSEVMMQYDRYFAFNRKSTFENKFGRIFVKSEKSPLNIYRKGIRCYDTKTESIVDFDLNDLAINEDRLAAIYNINFAIQELMDADVPTPVMLQVIKEENTSYFSTDMSDSVLSSVKVLIDGGNTFTTPELRKIGGMIFGGGMSALVIRAEWYKKLKLLGLIKSAFDFMGGAEAFIRTDTKDTKGIAYHLSAFNISLPIMSGKCESDAFFSNGTAHVKDDTKLCDGEITAHIIKKMPVEYLMGVMGIPIPSKLATFDNDNDLPF